MKTAPLLAAAALSLPTCFAQIVVPPVPKMLDASIVLNVVTVPEGADVFLAGVNYGKSPMRMVYSAEDFAKLKVEDGCTVETAQLAIQWPTGAAGALPELRMCNGAASDYLVTGYRPASAPHADRDELFGAQRAKDREAETHYLAQPVPKTSAASTVRLTVDSDPQGAQIVWPRNTQGIGQAPAGLVMQLYSVALRPGRCGMARVVQARWPSGAVSKPAYISMCNGPDADYQVTIARPDGAPGADIDRSHAANLKPPPRREYRLAHVMQPAPVRVQAQAQQQPPLPPPPASVQAAAPQATTQAPRPAPPQQPQAQAGAAPSQQQAQPLRQPLANPGKVTLVLTALPEGAEIFQRGVSVGRSPISLHYDPVGLREQMRAKGCAQVTPLEARWPSGAVQVATGLSLCQGGDNDYGWTFVRPSDAPGLAVDQNFSAQLALQRMQHDQANLQALRQAQQAQQQADAQARAQAEIEAQEGSEALLKGLLSLIPQARPPAPAATPEPAPFGIRPPLRCVTKNRFGRLETECQ